MTANNTNTKDMQFNRIYKRATNGKVSQWLIETKYNKYRTTSGYADGAQTTSEWTTVEGKNVGRANETSAHQQCLKEAAALYQKKLDKGYFADITDVDGKTYFKPMLAAKWEDYKDSVVYPIYSQPKLDGIRCIVNSTGMWSRNGKAIVSAPHIYEALKPLLDKDPNLIFDGELYCDKLANDFNKICSLVKKTKPSASDIAESASVLEYHIYDLPSVKDIFSKRFAELRSKSFNDKIVIVETSTISNEGEAYLHYGQYIDEGYEGQILRLDSKYENKRTKSLLKHKTFMDSEFVIKDVCEGEGNKSGMCGYMVFQAENGQTFKSNVKASWDSLTEMLKNKKSLIGKTATIQYFDLTPGGIPRFPYVIGIAREDYE